MPPVTMVLRRLHNVLGLVVGAQVLLWVASGLFFTLIPIERVRGDHLRSHPHDMIAPTTHGLARPEAIAAASGEPLMSLRLKPGPQGLVWQAETHTGMALYDAASGAVLSPIPEAIARDVAAAGWAGKGDLATITLVDPAPREAGRGAGRAMWRADFAGDDNATFWIDPQTAEIAAVRTAWWRAFDLFWGLHIMDWTSRETISTWWMKLFAFGALMLTVAGLWLVVVRTAQGRLLR